MDVGDAGAGRLGARSVRGEAGKGRQGRRGGFAGPRGRAECVARSLQIRNRILAKIVMVAL